MNEHEIHDMIFKQVCKEIAQIADQIQKSGTMSEKDLDRLDKLYHTKKDMLTAKAMADSEEYEGMSGMRGRSPMTGRYVSRESNNSYTDGYSQGYSEAMNMMRGGEQGNNGGNSGHYPMQPYYPYPEKRW